MSTDQPGAWTMPVAVGVISAAGLVAALLSDGAGDVLAWLALAVPVAVCGRVLIQSRRR